MASPNVQIARGRLGPPPQVGGGSNPGWGNNQGARPAGGARLGQVGGLTGGQVGQTAGNRPGQSGPVAAPAAGPPAGAPQQQQPFLTPAQQASKDAYNTTYGYKISDLNAALTAYQGQTAVGQAAALRARAVGGAAANQNTAARGIFNSSIQASDMTDLNTTLTLRQNLLNTNLATFTSKTNTAIQRANDANAVTQNAYNVLGVGNAESVPVTAATPGSPAAAAAPTSSASSKPGGGKPRGGGGPGWGNNQGARPAGGARLGPGWGA
jgi:hypothetical protein